MLLLPGLGTSLTSIPSFSLAEMDGSLRGELAPWWAAERSSFGELPMLRLPLLLGVEACDLVLPPALRD